MLMEFSYYKKETDIVKPSDYENKPIKYGDKIVGTVVDVIDLGTTYKIKVDINEKLSPLWNQLNQGRKISVSTRKNLFK